MKKIDLKDKILIEFEDQKRFSKLDLTCSCVYKDDDMRIVRTLTTLYDKNNKPYKGFNSYEILKRTFCKFNKIESKNGKIINTVFDNVYKEKYPSSEDFGTKAWSCSTESSVRKILKNCFNKSEKEIELLVSNLTFS